MSTLKTLTERRRDNGFSVKEMLKDDREWVACWSCRKKHPLRSNNADHDYQDFHSRHPTERGCIVLRVGPKQMERSIKRAQKRKQLRHDAIVNFTDNASVLEAFQGSATTLDLTGFTTATGLVNSATGGWSSQWIDNSSNLYLEYLYQLTVTAWTGAAANNSALYFYTAGSFSTAALPANTNGATVANSSSTAATLTFLTIASNATGFSTIKVVAYAGTSMAAAVIPPFTCSQAYNGWLPQTLWWCAINFSGQTVKPTSMKTQGVYNTVA